MTKERIDEHLVDFKAIDDKMVAIIAGGVSMGDGIDILRKIHDELFEKIKLVAVNIINGAAYDAKLARKCFNHSRVKKINEEGVVMMQQLVDGIRKLPTISRICKGSIAYLDRLIKDIQAELETE